MLLSNSPIISSFPLPTCFLGLFNFVCILRFSPFPLLPTYSYFPGICQRYRNREVRSTSTSRK